MAALEIDLFTEGQDHGKPQLHEEFFCPFEICASAEVVLVSAIRGPLAHASIRNGPGWVLSFGEAGQL